MGSPGHKNRYRSKHFRNLCRSFPPALTVCLIQNNGGGAGSRIWLYIAFPKEKSYIRGQNPMIPKHLQDATYLIGTVTYFVNIMPDRIEPGKDQKPRRIRRNARLVSGRCF